MKVEDFFSRLSLQELSNLAIGTSGGGAIGPGKEPTILGYLNETMLRLHSRFVLCERSLLLLQVGHITNYHFKKEFTESAGSTKPYLYIKDSLTEPFEEDVIKVLSVSDEYQRTRPINELGNRLSVFTPRQEMLQVPHPEDNSLLSVNYQARAVPLKLKGDDLLKQEFDLPFALEGALAAYIAHLVYSHMNGQDNQIKSADFERKYEMICAEVEALDLINATSLSQHEKFDERGFV